MLLGRTTVWYMLPFVTAVFAQLPNTFQWSFGGLFAPQPLEECQTLQIVISPFDSSDSPASAGIPPFYMLAFEPGGVPTTSALGSDLTRLLWQVDHVRGSQIMLAVIDSAGNTGGVSKILFDVTAGSDTSCLSAPSPSSAVLQANVSDSLFACQPWGLAVTGGKQPYTVVLSQLDSAAIIVATMEDGDDVFTYINRGDPGWQMMASVYDATGQWGTSTGVVQSTSSDATCPGLESLQFASRAGASDGVFAPTINFFPPGNSPSSLASVTARANDSTHISATPYPSAMATESTVGIRPGAQLVIGLSLGIGIPLIAALLAALWFYTRRREKSPRSPLDILASPIDINRLSMRDAIVATPFDLRLYLLGYSRTPSVPTDTEADSSAAPYAGGRGPETSQRRHSRSFSSYEFIEPVLQEITAPSRTSTSTDFAAGHNRWSTVLVDIPTPTRSPPPVTTVTHEQRRRVAQVYLRPSSRGSISQLMHDPELQDVILRTASPESIASHSGGGEWIETDDSHPPVSR
ncbi:uncharacterized protein PHACADRAFT_208564 [Phanerochaete carnosa HHB-10118-sp]|uniref:Mid2 domain-containing protein n=1 Tax=Phanerochaete carnosa (strain HHB-10118-sp) TaxID=650164 RepID=K5W7T5_PHACS|nr:uncharacterized protein PHACADRAFT_208564 [Phanerochaete carnosa HHB-10118-sp]EKM55034.1 hypothetical protein PHACADRAFT_208564 [Phanerochaete carnosa HHB-10118-sp]